MYNSLHLLKARTTIDNIFLSLCYMYRTFSCDVIAAMLEGQNNTFSLPWEIRSIFMQNCFIVSALQHGRRENTLYARIPAKISLSITLILICITLSPVTLLGNNFSFHFTALCYKRNVIYCYQKPSSRFPIHLMYKDGIQLKFLQYILINLLNLITR